MNGRENRTGKTKIQDFFINNYQEIKHNERTILCINDLYSFLRSCLLVWTEGREEKKLPEHKQQPDTEKGELT